MLNVGHGDSFIVELNAIETSDQTHWGVVDCQTLSTNGQVPALEFFRSRPEIVKLDFVCLTHPHSDHFTGFRELFEYFTSEGREIEEFWDFGLTSQKALSFSKDYSDYSELDWIYDKVLEQSKRRHRLGRTFYRILNPGTLCWQKGETSIIALSPSSHHVLSATEKVSDWFSHSESRGELVGDANTLSIVLILICGRQAALLGADASSAVLKDALPLWAKESRRIGAEDHFALVKVPHHGSWHTNYAPLWNDFCKSGRTVAFVSGGIRDNLPSVEFLQNMKLRQIRVYCTNLGLACQDVEKEVSDSPLNPKTEFALADLFDGMSEDLRPGFGRCTATLLSTNEFIRIDTQFNVPCVYVEGAPCRVAPR
jgi:hypothetical protein